MRESIRLEVTLGAVYRFWRRLENLPQFMTHLERVTETGDGKSHWVASGPAGLAVEWDAEIIQEERVTWPTQARSTTHSSTNYGIRYDAERQLTKALPKLAKAATAPKLRKAFEAHLEETLGQIERLEQVFESLDEKVRGKHCDGIAGIIEEGQSIMEEDFDETTMDACLIAAGQRAEHYEMAAYGTLGCVGDRAWATRKQLALLQADAGRGESRGREVVVARRGRDQPGCRRPREGGRRRRRARGRRCRCEEGACRESQRQCTCAAQVAHGLDSTTAADERVRQVAGCHGARSRHPPRAGRDRLSGLTAYRAVTCQGHRATAPEGHTEQDDVVLVEVVTDDVRPGMVADVCGQRWSRS